MTDSTPRPAGLDALLGYVAANLPQNDPERCAETLAAMPVADGHEADRPYTEEDLRAEAASQHKALTEDPDHIGIGEAMDDDIVLSTETTGGGQTWRELLPQREDFDTARREIDNLIGHAADVSRWAVNLGADGLEPGTGVIDIGWNNGPLDARLHIAFAPGTPDDERDALVKDLKDAIAGTVPVR